MSFWPIPDYKFKKLCDVTPEFLGSIGVKLLLLDLDNTMSPYKVDAPDAELAAWAERMRAGGVRLFIVSNNRGERPEKFASALSIPYVKVASKPSRRGLRQAMAAEGAAKEETALAGDQIYTDVFAAKRMGVTAILVEPIKFTNIFLAIRYVFEYPFRLFGKKR